MGRTMGRVVIEGAVVEFCAGEKPHGESAATTEVRGVGRLAAGKTYRPYETSRRLEEARFQGLLGQSRRACLVDAV